MSELTIQDLRELYSENMKRAVSVCKELYELKKNADWLLVGQNLDLLRVNGEKMADARSIGRQETLRGLERHVQNLDAKLNG